MTAPLKATFVDRFAAVSTDAWNRLAGTAKGGDAYHPFLSHAYLSALEDSGSAGAKAGWLPHHLLLTDAAGTLVGAVPTYAKSHSQGEYVFDHGWADAFERAGGRYYPKLQCTVPFTPATGPRLLSLPGDDAALIRPALSSALKQECERLGLSSVHVTFLPENEATTLEAENWLIRHDQQFHFLNAGYRDYQDFLDSLASRKRKALRKERATALSPGIDIDWLTGSDLTESVWDQFFAFYMDTGSRKWGRPYLTRAFFSLIGERMADDILLVMARRDGRYIAGAINFIGSDRIYGRHWGCVEDHPFLHFEVCYHQAIDFAIARALKVVEAGAQGEHKLARGYVPVTTYSAHHLSHPGLRRAVADYLVAERRHVAEAGDYLREHAPFRKDLAERED